MWANTVRADRVVFPGHECVVKWLEILYSLVEIVVLQSMETGQVAEVGKAGKRMLRTGY